jgi:SAM-dependent methyltransferase
VTEQLAQIAGIERGATILDAGSGLGGPSRYLASTYDCRVIGTDLSPSFVAVAQLLAQRTGLNALVSFQIGDLLALPAAGQFCSDPAATTSFRITRWEDPKEGSGAYGGRDGPNQNAEYD